MTHFDAIPACAGMSGGSVTEPAPEKAGDLFTGVAAAARSDERR